ncbi:hypothetical protein H0E84_01610 [Luteimonas sp. SJ-92]|uniref:Uncharacterized protein n=1 Tax=Luteimonas salinisoli TaxID=2752307 RepID=A0A853J7K2_9GAMM|nr:hypothetical protein [Luteimonas salinisoli]NZA25071.1 hypothetical protein [Luteimonas salinisoli]
MITAGTLTAKIATFIAGKAATHIGSLAFDKRRKACRALTKLYFCVSALDEACAEILGTFEDFRSDSDAFSFPLMNALNNHMHEVAHATNMFVDLKKNRGQSRFPSDFAASLSLDSDEEQGSE